VYCQVMCNVILTILRETGMPVSTTAGHMPKNLVAMLCGAYISFIYQTTPCTTRI